MTSPGDDGVSVDTVSFGGPDDPRPPRWREPVTRVEASRWVRGGLVAVIVAGLAVAVLGRVTEAAAPAASSTVVPHGLDDDQAACFAFSLGERRAALVLGAASPIGVGPQAGAMRDELRALDDLVTTYTTADYRLISAFADVAAQSTRVLGVHSRPIAGDIANARYFAIRAAADTCASLARFDVDSMRPLASASP